LGHPVFNNYLEEKKEDFLYTTGPTGATTNQSALLFKEHIQGI